MSSEPVGGVAHRLVLDVPTDLVAFDDHFPGAPVLPAYAQLHAVVGRIRRLWPDLGPWRGAPGMKFHSMVAPGTRLDLELARPDRGPKVKVTLRAAERIVSSGTLVFGGDA